jgi:hypothetical protein
MDELFEKWVVCMKGGSWESMTLAELQQLESILSPNWRKVGKNKKTALLAEIKRRQEINRKARLLMRGDGPPPMLPTD